jgi:hypothetical protein
VGSKSTFSTKAGLRVPALNDGNVEGGRRMMNGMCVACWWLGPSTHTSNHMSGRRVESYEWETSRII